MCVFLNSLPIVVELNNSNYIEKLNGYLCNSEKIERVRKIARAQQVQFVERVQFFPNWTGSHLILL